MLFRSPSGLDPQTWPSGEDLLSRVAPGGPHVDALAYGLDPEPEHHPHSESPSTEETPSDPPPKNVPVLPLQNIVNLSSADAAASDVLLEINAELHIYGRAKPNTKLSIHGQDVTTRPDGTFSLRRPLPRGALVLPLVLTQENGSEGEV